MADIEDLGYRKFKTPFYEVQIGDSSGQKLIDLPHHILRLIQKVEIFEPLGGSGETKEFTTINLTFIEGSREPASPDASLGTSGLYKITTDGVNTDKAISGSLTNRTGIITDLRFSGNKGLTFLSETEQKTNRIDDKIQKNVDGKYTSRKWNTDPAPPEFLFNERNQILVKWGYREDPATWRQVRSYIIAIKIDFPENDQVKTTITCQDTGAFADQIAVKNGKPFGRKVTTPAGDSIVIFKDLPTDELLRFIVKEAGIPAIISTNLPTPNHDFDKQKIWVAGESFKQFMDRLAELHNCYWKFLPHSKSGEDTLVFIKKSDLENSPLKIDKRLVTYRAPGSILKSVNIGADFGGITGAAIKSIDENGNTVGDEQQIAIRQLAAQKSNRDNKKSETQMSVNPVSANPIGGILGLQNSIAPEGFIGALENTPRTDIGAIKDMAGSEADRRHRLISLEFTTIGYTRLTPGTIDIGGLGVRYSGLYRIMSVTHTIDSNGYITKCAATSQFLPGGGAKPQEPVATQKEQDVVIRQFLEAKGTH